MAKSIVSVGLELADDEVSSVDFQSRASLSDWDIVLFRPNISWFCYMGDTTTYLGKPALGDDMSFRLRESCEHWHREITEAVDAGTTVIGFLSDLVQVYIATGETKHSGTGRNRQTTRIVTEYSNYRSVPISVEPTSRSGSTIKIVNSSRSILASYWDDFGEFSEFRVTFPKTVKDACMVTKHGESPVALKLSQKSGGTLLLLPDLRIELGEVTKVDENGKVYYSKTAKGFSAKLISSVVALDKVLHSSAQRSPEPSWMSQDRFALAGEAEVLGELLIAEGQLEEARKRKEKLAQKLAAAGGLRDLLFENGTALEVSVLKALTVLGFSTRRYRDEESEFDVIFESNEGRLLGEVEGKDAKAIGVDKLRQLSMNIHEDLSREEVEEPAKGILFGNGYRLRDPAERPEVFTGKCITAARSTSTGLVNSVDLFRVVRYLSYSNDEDFAWACRKALLDGAGPVKFPETPDVPGQDRAALESGS